MIRICQIHFFYILSSFLVVGSFLLGAGAVFGDDYGAPDSYLGVNPPPCVTCSCKVIPYWYIPNDGFNRAALPNMNVDSSQGIVNIQTWAGCQNAPPVATGATYDLWQYTQAWYVCGPAQNMNSEILIGPTGAFVINKNQMKCSP